MVVLVLPPQKLSNAKPSLSDCTFFLHPPPLLLAREYVSTSFLGPVRSTRFGYGIGDKTSDTSFISPFSVCYYSGIFFLLPLVEPDVAGSPLTASIFSFYFGPPSLVPLKSLNSTFFFCGTPLLLQMNPVFPRRRATNAVFYFLPPTLPPSVVTLSILLDGLPV